MIRKPTSIADFLKTVAFVEHPDLLPIDRHILLCVALFADANTGRRAYPGVSNLAKMTKVSERTIQRRLRRLEAKEIIVCEASAKGGRGMAAEYRIKLESPAFLAEEDREKGDSIVSPIDIEKGDTGRSKGCHLERERVTLGAQRVTSGVTPSESSSEIHPTLHPIEIRKEDGGMDSAKPAAKESEERDGDKFFGKHHKTMGRCEKKTREQIEDLADREGQGHPWELMNEIAYRFQNRPQGLGGLRDRWGFFLREAPRNIGDLKSESWWQEKYDVEYQQRLAATIQRQREALCRLRADPEPEPELVLAPGEAF